jgi:hypothetical protein
MHAFDILCLMTVLSFIDEFYLGRFESKLV